MIAAKTEDYPFSLDSKRGKYTCPQCGHKRKFTRYYATEGDYTFPEEAGVGWCDRKVKCGYHKPPREFFAENPEERTIAFGKHKSNHQVDKANKVKTDLLSFLSDIETCDLMGAALYIEVSQPCTHPLISNAKYCVVEAKFRTPYMAQI